MYEKRSWIVKFIALITIPILAVGTMLYTENVERNINSTIIEVNKNFKKVNTPLKGILQEKVIELIKNDKEYINKENDKNKKINEIKENSYYAKLKKSNILRENNTINPSKHFDAIKFVKDSNVVSNTIKNMTTKELIDNFSQMNNQDKISAVIIILSRNEFKNEYANQLELANASVLKEENNNTKEIEEIEKSFNEWFNTKSKQEIDAAKQIRKTNLITHMAVVGILICFVILIILPRR